MFPDMPQLPEGVDHYIEAVCQQCDNPTAGIRLGVDLVNKRDKPQNKVLALVVSASRVPPTITKIIKREDGTDHMIMVPNPDFSPSDRVIVATLEEGWDLCFDRDCFMNAMDEIWKLTEKRVKLLWADYT